MKHELLWVAFDSLGLLRVLKVRSCICCLYFIVVLKAERVFSLVKISTFIILTRDNSVYTIVINEKILKRTNCI